jgi:hypothetical protein
VRWALCDEDASGGVFDHRADDRDDGAEWHGGER